MPLVNNGMLAAASERPSGEKATDVSLEEKGISRSSRLLHKSQTLISSRPQEASVTPSGENVTA